MTSLLYLRAGMCELRFYFLRFLLVLFCLLASSFSSSSPHLSQCIYMCTCLLGNDNFLRGESFKNELDRESHALRTRKGVREKTKRRKKEWYGGCEYGGGN